MYGSKIDTVRDLPGGYMSTGRRDSEMPVRAGDKQKKREVFLVTTRTLALALALAQP